MSSVTQSVPGWQEQVAYWISSRFGTEALLDPRERIARAIEEACELAQAAGMGRGELEEIAEYVYRQPPGVVRQEAGGLVVALLAFACAHQFDLLAEAEREIDRVLHVPADVSRQRQAVKAAAGIARRPAPFPNTPID